MAQEQRNVTDIIMPGTPLAGQLFQTDDRNKLVAIDISAALEGWVIAFNATSGLWEARAAGAASLAGFPFAHAFPFAAAGDFWEIPMGLFGATLVAWSIRLSTSGNATFAVSAATTITGSFADLIGGGTAPSVAGAIGAFGAITDWSDDTLASGETLKVTCSTLTAPQATLTLHFERV